MNLVPLIELSRADTLECQHFGAIAVVDRHGKLLARAGDPHWLTFSRSTLKALQALPFMEAGGPAQFGYRSEQIAMLCASHGGEDKHVAQTQTMLAKAGLSTSALRCGCHVPGIFEVLGKNPPEGAVFDERHNNCSGKHAGFLAYCVQHGLTLDDYIAPAHPLQQAIRRDVARATGVDAALLKMGIDGCSAPNYALPLSHLARGYARLASGAQDAEFGASFTQLADAMTAHPELVSGTGRNDLAFMRAGRGDWVTKIGADGVQVVGSRSRAEAFAIKIIDANKIALHATTVEVLHQLGWLDQQQAAELEDWRARDILNARGMLVGARKPVFSLLAGN
jgi:L-asparaginase II